MAGDNNIKLFKIASEINIGRDTIVDFLNAKGFDIVNKPTASLTPAMVELVYDKFKREKKAAETVREKIQKHKDIRTESKKTVDDKYWEERHKDPNTHLPVEPKEQMEVIPKTIEKVLESEPKIVKVPEAEPVKQEPIVEKLATEVEPKDAITEKPKTTKKSSEPKTEDVQPVLFEELVRQVEPVEIISAEQERSEIPEVKTSEPEELIIKQISDKVEEIADGTRAIKQKEPEVQIDENLTFESEISREEPTITDDTTLPYENEDDVASGRSLRGLTVLGKIEIKSRKNQKDKTPDKGTRKPHDDRQDRKEKSDKQDKPKKFEKDYKKPTHDRHDRFDKKKPQKPQPETTPVVVNKAKTKAPEYSDSPKQKQFKKRKHSTVDTSITQPSTKQVFDLKSKFKDKPKIEEKAVDKDDKKKRKRKKSIRELISQEEVDRAIRETLSGMDSSSTMSQRSRLRMKRKAEREEKEQRIRDDKALDDKTLKLSEFVTTSDLASLMDISPSEVIMKCMELNLMVTINQRLDKETISIIALDYGFDVEFLDQKQVLSVEEEVENEVDLKHRAPIVTIMGHVDHGKTSLLDYIRSAKVVAGEAGGITQHIGAYRVKLPSGKSITFLDTPGHEAFTAMRARGAQVTDIVVLVVAADDSVMPQSIEAISHAKAAKVPIIVAINKIDKIDANPDRIKQQLADYGVLVEEWGGNHQSVALSAKFGTNVDQLLEKILLEAELLELKANPDRKSKGTVIESNMKQGFGAVATIIVQTGTLKVGDPFVAGFHSGRVRTMLDERENRVESAGPSDPILVVGFDGLPEAGDTFIVTSSEIEAREIANERKKLRREQELRQTKLMTLDQISAQIQLGGVKELNLVIKGDVGGSVEALSDSLQKLSTDEVRVNILHKGVGTISETDVMLASASGAVVIGFNVNTAAKARKTAENEQVDIRNYNIIYDCINEIRLALEGLLAPEYKEEITAVVEVRKTFKISRLGVIAGCYVLSGKITRNDRIRVRRDGFSQFEGGISSLKRGKDDVKEVDTAFECGVQIDGYNDLQENDIIEAFKLVEIKRKLK